MRYYLETNALRKINSKLQVVREQSFTSNLAIFEIISGINEKEYSLLKSVISNVTESLINIDWRYPDEIIAGAFPSIGCIEHKKEDLKKLCRILISSFDFTDFQLKTNELKYGLDYFSNLDKFYSTRFIQSTISGIKEIKQGKEKFKKYTIMNQIYKDYVDNLIRDISNNCVVNNSLTIYSLVQYIANRIDKDLPERDKKRIFNSYNGTIKFFVEAFSVFSISLLKDGKIPAKNDWVDIQHILYLQDNDNINLVTEDKLLINLLNKLWPNKVIDSKSLIKICA